MCGSDIFLICLAVLFPPVGVWVKRGICSADSLINLALCCLGYFPGLLHAWYIIYTYPDAWDYEPVDREAEGTVTYYYHQQQQGPQNYGTVGSSAQGQRSEGSQGQQSGPVNKGNSSAEGQRDGGEGSAGQTAPPPSYADVIKGDHKVQSSD
ncbi:UPF0057-domain-containing protein [Patellaria atrata CBS 101060]|uniref:UPF0057-domain-containing protein n=1 Tax=Patellaria atrata CBS 101060 TaxID=1346257 RepID=A0A9P4SBW7_9PEZI|nr:UPF0057-domain-containing protein [Patellaria atrata CBS 101060]